MPLTIRFGHEEFEDRRELTPEEFWRRCQGKGALPETAAPAPGAFIAAYQQAASEGADAVLCLTLSSKVSASYASAVTAAATSAGVPVRVVDTRSMTMGEGLMVIAAAEEAAAGAGLDELAAAAEDRAGGCGSSACWGGSSSSSVGGVSVGPRPSWAPSSPLSRSSWSRMARWPRSRSNGPARAP